MGAGDTSSLAVFEGDGESIVEDLGPEHWPTLHGAGGPGETPARAVAAAASLLDVSELASPRDLQEEHEQQTMRETGTQHTPSGSGGGAGGRLFGDDGASIGMSATPSSPVGPAPVTTRSIERSHVFRQDALAHGTDAKTWELN